MPTVKVALVAITGVWVNKFPRSTSDTANGARYKVEYVGSNQSTCVCPGFNNLVAVWLISFNAPFTRARSAIVFGSIISLSADINAVTAATPSLTPRSGASRVAGNLSNLPAFVGSAFKSSPYSPSALENFSLALNKASPAFPGICFLAILAARKTLAAVISSVTACVVRSINSCASSKTMASRSGKIG